jgi:hypothetical protein
MTGIDPRWSLAAVIRDFQPHHGWREWFAEAYAQAMESSQPEEQLKGWRTAAVILGDMHACLLCLFVCHKGCSLAPLSSDAFQGHVDLCLWEMGLAAPSQPGNLPIGQSGKSERFSRMEDEAQVWLKEQLQPFNGNMDRAAEFAMRLIAIRLGLLRGPSEPSLEQILDRGLWQRTEIAATAPSKNATARRKRWWQFWK